MSAPFWERQFPGAAGPTGQSLQLDGTSYTVVGVLPRDMHLDEFALSDILIPLVPDSQSMRERDSRSLQAIARLNEGVSVAQAQANLDALCRQLSLTYPATNGSWGARVQRLGDSLVSPSYRTTLSLFLGASLLLLLTACANAAGLLLARALNRGEELAVRAALGASRWDLIRQLLVEGALLGAMGGAQGIALARWGVQGFVYLASSWGLEVPRLAEISLDARALSVAAVVSLLIAIGTALAPARAGSNVDLNTTLRGAGRAATRGRQSQRMRSLFVAAQFALATVLLTSAGLFVRSLLRLQQIDPGFDPRNVLSGYLSLSEVRYSDPKQVILFSRQLAERMLATPGSTEFAVASTLPLTSPYDVHFSVDGRPNPKPSEEPSSIYATVSPEYFDVLRIALLRGRLLFDQDSADTGRVVVVNENLAREYFGDADPIGRHLTILGPAVPRQPKPGSVEIVGIVANAHAVGLDEVPFAEMYFPFSQEPVRDMYLALRTASGIPPDERMIRGAVSALDSNASVSEIKTMEGRVYESLGENRFNMILIGTTGLIAVSLAALGTYGIIAFYVAQRTREIGIRLALGAQRTKVMQMCCGSARS